jgi:DNA-binding transcriptional LysR family regulator
MNNISIRKMRVFLSALELRSFTKASVAQNISQPAATIIVNQIEEEFQCELFERQGTIRSALATPAGKRVAETFSRIIATYDGELATFSANASGKRRQRRILIQTSYDLFINRDWLRGLMNYYADDDLSVEVMSRHHIVEEVANRKATIGLIDGNVENQQVDYAPLGVMQLLVAVPGTNKLINPAQSELSWNDLGPEIVLFSNINPVLRRQVQAKIKASGPDAPKLTLCDSSAAMISLLQSGTKAAIVPDAMRTFFEAWANCRFHRFSDVSFSGQFGLVTPWGYMNRLPGQFTRIRCCFTDTTQG